MRLMFAVGPRVNLEKNTSVVDLGRIHLYWKFDK